MLILEVLQLKHIPVHAGDYFEVADHVIMMADFHAVDVTTQAKAVAAQLPARTVDVVRSVPCCPTHPRVCLHVSAAAAVRRNVIASSFSDRLCFQFRRYFGVYNFLWSWRRRCQVPCPASLWPLVNAKVRAHDVDGIRFGGTELELRPGRTGGPSGCACKE